MEDDVKDYVEDFETYLSATEEYRFISERCRDYKDHKQWTDDEIATLRERGQAPVVVNRVAPKIEALKGIVINQRSDPKAWPRTPKHEQASNAVTDALRYVNDAVDFDAIEEEAAENIFIEGTGAAIVEIRPSSIGPEVEITHIPWDRFYYDPMSMRSDFKDAKYLGIVIWMDMEDAQDRWPDKAEEIGNLASNYGDSNSETHDDKPRWIDRKRKRIKVCQHYCNKGGWREVFFTDNLILQSGESPYQNEQGQPVCPIEAQSAFVDRDNNRYGPTFLWLDLQDEVNHRRSKALHLLSVRQTAGRRGAIADIRALKSELKKPDGHVEYDGEKGDFEILQTGDMAAAQFNLLQEAKQELDAISVNAQLSGERQGDISGRAVMALQQGGMLEIAPLLSRIRAWKKRIFTQVWFRVKQFWTEEKWVRVTDDFGTLRWVGLNQQMTVGQMLQEKAQDESVSPEIRQQAAMVLQAMTQAQDPRLNQVVEIRNDVSQVDVDIIIDFSPDAMTVQNEQFQIVSQLAMARPEVPFTEVIKLSTLRNKEQILESMAQAAEAASQAATQQQQLDIADKASQIQEREARTEKTAMEAQQTQLENAMLMIQPMPVTSVAI